MITVEVTGEHGVEALTTFQPWGADLVPREGDVLWAEDRRRRVEQVVIAPVEGRITLLTTAADDACDCCGAFVATAETIVRGELCAACCAAGCRGESETCNAGADAGDHP